MMERKALGRGLAALIPQKEKPAAALPPPRGGVEMVPLEQIRPNPHQPRRRFDEAALDELAASIREKGILQPLLVRRAGEQYQLIAGERRWQAAKRAGLSEVPVLVRQADDREELELALVENMQRQDLNPVEEARGLRQLTDEFALTQEEVAQRVGKERSTVANALRLLRLPEAILAMVESGELSAGHARTILGLEPEKQLELGRLVREKGLSVRDIERLAGQMKKGPKLATAKVKERPLAILDLEEQMKRRLATKVQIVPSGRGGHIRIDYYSNDDLTRLWQLINA